jgi:hypothetical protein
MQRHGNERREGSVSLREIIDTLEKSATNHGSDRGDVVLRGFKEIEARLEALEKKPTTVLTSENLTAVK